ncbi:MAG: hypothetical protein MZV70_54465 [Desulfobacterales bacterium]|nr:hypothetical protein [Desulfobacterales bacterium]
MTETEEQYQGTAGVSRPKRKRSRGKQSGGASAPATCSTPASGVPIQYPQPVRPARPREAGAPRAVVDTLAEGGAAGSW